MKTTEETIIVSQEFSRSKADVWKAITEPSQMKQWFFENMPDFKAEVGFETQFLITHEERHFTHCWKIIKVIPEERITYEWNYTEHSGNAHVIFELEEQGDQTKLTVTNLVLEDFPDDIPEFKRESCVGGWEYFIQGNLKTYLDA